MANVAAAISMLLLLFFVAESCVMWLVVVCI